MELLANDHKTTKKKMGKMPGRILDMIATHSMGAGPCMPALSCRMEGVRVSVQNVPKRR
jgi:hypothetical protein